MSRSAEPAVRGLVVAHVRRALEEGDLYGPAWRALRRKDAVLAAALEDTAMLQWVPAAAYAALLDETAVIAGGTDRLRALGVRWSKLELGDGGRFGSMRRAWTRAFGTGPAEIARLAPHIWRASMRNNGRVEHGDSGRGFVRLALEGAPIVRGSRAWQKLIEGSLEGLLELASPDVTVQFGPSAVEPELVEAIVLWPTR